MHDNISAQKHTNIRKTWLLMAGFFIFVILIGWFFGYVLKNPGILYFAVVFSLAMNFFAYWYSDKVALKMSGAKPAAREAYPEFYRIVEHLCRIANLPMPKLYTIRDEQINAFATGRNAAHAAVAVTEGALRKLNSNELEGVLAHELSHIGNNDILVSSIAVVLAGFVAILADWFIRMSFWGNLSGGDDRNDGGGYLMIVGIIFAILAPLAATLIQLAVSRKRELLADSSGAQLTNNPEELAGALEKIEHDHSQLRMATNATAHLFITNPFKNKAKMTWMARLFLTHPPLEQRIKILRGMK